MNARIEKYLKAYNLVQLASWLTAIMVLPFNFIYAFYTISFVQSLSIAEVYHAFKKWNNSSPFLCFVQIGARLFILYFTADILFISISNPIPNFNEVIYVMLAFWCIAEIIRYAYYITQLFKKENNIITWLRYSAFIICYPIGLTCEFFVLFTVFKYYDILAIKILIVIVAISYFILFPKLFKHLLKQRKQKL